MRIRDYRNEAKICLKEKNARFIYMLAFFVVMFLLYIIPEMLSATMGKLLADALKIGFQLIGQVMAVGLWAIALRIYRSEDFGFLNLVGYFYRIGSVILYQLFLLLICIPLLLISLAIIILAGANIGWGTTNFDVSAVAGGWFLIILAFAILIVPMIIFSIVYALWKFILIDNPDMSTTESMRKAREMSRGHRWEIVKLYLFYCLFLFLILLAGSAVMGILKYFLIMSLSAKVFLEFVVYGLGSLAIGYTFGAELNVSLAMLYDNLLFEEEETPNVYYN